MKAPRDFTETSLLLEAIGRGATAREYVVSRVQSFLGVKDAKIALRAVNNLVKNKLLERVTLNGGKTPAVTWSKAGEERVARMEAARGRVRAIGPTIDGKALTAACAVFEALGKAAKVLGCDQMEPRTELVAMTFACGDEPTLHFAGSDGSTLDVPIEELAKVPDFVRELLVAALRWQS